MFSIYKTKSKNTDIHVEDSLDADVLQALEQDYVAMLIVDSNTSKVAIYKGPEAMYDDFEEFCGGDYYYDSFIRSYIDRYIYIEDKSALIYSLQLSSVVAELKTNRQIGITARRVDGDRLRYMRYEAKHISLDDNNRFLLVMKDVDAEVHQEQSRQELLKKAYLTAEKASLAKNQFMHNMSHDIRTPLNAIVGYTTVASDSIDDPESIKSYLGKIEDASVHLLHIINEILDLGELESGNLRLTYSSIKMTDLVTQVMDALNPQIKDKQTNITVINNDTNDKPVLVDVFHVNRVLTNLLSNAVKFTDVDGNVTFTINSSVGSCENKVHYEFIVEDDGIGIAEDFLDKIFDPFERERTSTKSKKNGVGIGLAITKNIVDALHGSIVAHSIKGQGSVFTVELQFELAPVVVLEKEDNKPTKEVSLAGKRILVVDDSKVNRDIAMAILGSMNIQTESAADGDIAVEMVSNSDISYYDLILMDIQMPQMDGIEATRAIRSLHRDDAKTIPVVALTADVFDDTRKQADEVGMNGFLTKPVNVKALKETIESILVQA